MEDFFFDIFWGSPDNVSGGVNVHVLVYGFEWGQLKSKKKSS